MSGTEARADRFDLRIVRVNPFTDTVWVQNTGPDFTTTAVHPFCHRLIYSSSIPNGTFFASGQIRQYTVVNLRDFNSDLWLYQNTGFANGANIIHGLDYGTGSTGRTNLASSVGKWNNPVVYLPDPAPGQELFYDGAGFLASDWTVGLPPTPTPMASPTATPSPSPLPPMMHMWNIPICQAQEGTILVPSSGFGTGMITYNDGTNLLSWDISYSGLTGPATAAHFHGPAAPGANAGVQIGIGTSNPAIGSTTITELQEVDLLAGLWYVNVHTSANSGGEIRGQVDDTTTCPAPSPTASPNATPTPDATPTVTPEPSPIQVFFDICQAQETSVLVPSSGSGFGDIVYHPGTNMLTWCVTYEGLTGPATGMHFHGPAAPGVNAGIQVNIGAISGLASPSIGGTFITAPQAADLLNGLWYVNIHTSANPGGELRGQVDDMIACPDPSPTPPPITPTATPPSVTPTATATPAPCCPGDANNSGSFVDASDFISVQANFGADNGVGGLGDANCSGSFVDASDFIAVQANFGADCD